MKEEILKKYFERELSTDVLFQDVDESEYKTGYDTFEVNVIQINNEDKFVVRPDHLLLLCRDAIKSNIKLEHLTTISLALLFSEYFEWDSKTKGGEIVDTVIYDWDSPEINFPITMSNLKSWETYLETGIYNWADFEKHSNH